MKKSYHSMEVPTMLAIATRRTDSALSESLCCDGNRRVLRRRLVQRLECSHQRKTCSLVGVVRGCTARVVVQIPADTDDVRIGVARGGRQLDGTLEHPRPRHHLVD